MRVIRKLVAAVVVTGTVAVTALVTTVTPNPSPGGTPIVTVTTKPTTMPVKEVRQVYDKPAGYIVGHHQGGTAWTVPLQAERWFKVALGYEDVAYNAMITPAGVTWQGRGEQYQSAASYGLNHDSVAFCWLGNLDLHPPTDAQLVAAAAYIKAARLRHPGAILVGHRDVTKLTGIPAGTACPGKYGPQALRASWLLVCGVPLAEAKRQAGL